MEVIRLLLSVPIDGYGLCEAAHTHEHEDRSAIELGRLSLKLKFLKAFPFFSTRADKHWISLCS